MAHERDLVAEALPHYEIGDEIGRGASGIVLSATHRRLGRLVAVKQLPRAYGADPYVKARFLNEARILAELNHSHVVSIYDYCEHQGLCLLVMEHLGGGSLWDREERERLSTEDAVATGLAMAAALDAAHQKGILHRDVKPDNAGFTATNVLKVTDFGIAKSTLGPGGLTQTGVVLGTPAYISPEQCSGRPVGPPADLYSLGVVLYELLAGRLPFPDTGDPISLILRHVNERPPPLDALTAAPGEVCAVVMRALEKDPNARFPTVLEFGLALAHAASSTLGPGWIEATDIDVLGGGELSAMAHQPQPPWSVRTLPPGYPATSKPATSHRVDRTTRTTLPAPRGTARGQGVVGQAWALADLTADAFPELSAWMREQLLRAREHEVVVCVAGAPGSGKTTLTEALTGLRTEDLDHRASTVAPVAVRWATSRHASVVRSAARARDDGTTARVPCDRIASFATADGNPGNIRNVEYVELATPEASLLAGVVVVDLPSGAGLGGRGVALATQAANTGAVLVVTRSAADPPDDGPRLAWLTELARRTPVAVGVTRTDIVREWPESVVALDRALRHAGARAVVRGVAATVRDHVDDSGVPELAVWVDGIVADARQRLEPRLAADVVWAAGVIGSSGPSPAVLDPGPELEFAFADAALTTVDALAHRIDQLGADWRDAAGSLASLADWAALAERIQCEVVGALSDAWLQLDAQAWAVLDEELRTLDVPRVGPPGARPIGAAAGPLRWPGGWLPARLGLTARILGDLTAALGATLPVELAFAGDELPAARRDAELARRRRQAIAVVAEFATALRALASARVQSAALDMATAVAADVEARRAVLQSVRARPVDGDVEARAAAVAAAVRPLLDHA
jgi:serine/threonine protein kinase